MKLPTLNLSPHKDLAKMFVYAEWKNIEKKIKSISYNIRNKCAGTKDISNINSLLSKYFKRNNDAESDAMKEALHQLKQRIMENNYFDSDSDWLDNECLSFWYHTINKDFERINKGKFKLS